MGFFLGQDTSEARELKWDLLRIPKCSVVVSTFPFDWLGVPSMSHSRVQTIGVWGGAMVKLEVGKLA